MRRILFNTPLRGTQRENKKGDRREARGGKPKNNEAADACPELDAGNADKIKNEKTMDRINRIYMMSLMSPSGMVEIPRPPFSRGQASGEACF